MKKKKLKRSSHKPQLNRNKNNTLNIADILSVDLRQVLKEAGSRLIDKLLKTVWVKSAKTRLKYLYKFIGLLLINLGERMLHKKSKFLLISSLIEEVFQADEIYVAVRSVRKYPLFLEFSIDIISSSDTVNWEYFRQELAMQLGCEISDIAVSFNKKRYAVDITNTAVSNFQKNTMPYEPHRLYMESWENEGVDKRIN